MAAHAPVPRRALLLAAAGMAAVMLGLVAVASTRAHNRASSLMEVFVPVQARAVDIAPGQMLSASQANYVRYRQLCVESCEREGRTDGSTVCTPDFLSSHWLGYVDECTNHGKCNLAKVYCSDGKYHVAYEG